MQHQISKIANVHIIYRAVDTVDFKNVPARNKHYKVEPIMQMPLKITDL